VKENRHCGWRGRVLSLGGRDKKQHLMAALFFDVVTGPKMGETVSTAVRGRKSRGDRILLD
jgi:hypothetical protein